MKIFVINMDRSPERLQHFREQADAVGVEFDRLPAVDGRALSQGEVDSQTDPKFEFKPLSRAEFGVFSSHRNAWRQLVESSEPCTAVFEDDVLLAPELKDALQAIENLSEAFDVIKLETTFRKVVIERSSIAAGSDVQLHRLLTWHGGAAGYVVSRSGAQKLLNLLSRIADPVDQVLFNPLSRICKSLNVLQAIPALCVQNDILARVSGEGQDFGSTIQQRRTWGQIFRFGPATDLFRLWSKIQERHRRQRLARDPANQLTSIEYAAYTREHQTCPSSST